MFSLHFSALIMEFIISSCFLAVLWLRLWMNNKYYYYSLHIRILLGMSTRNEYYFTIFTVKSDIRNINCDILKQKYSFLRIRNDKTRKNSYQQCSSAFNMNMKWRNIRRIPILICILSFYVTFYILFCFV